MGLRTLARTLTSNLLDEMGITPMVPVQPVPLEVVAASLNISVEYQLKASSEHGDAALWHRPELQLSMLDDYISPMHLDVEREGYRASIYSEGIRGRFSLAHELGHRILDLHTDTVEKSGWKSKDQEAAASLTASYLLMPDSWLRTIVDSSAPLEMELDWIFATAKQLRVSSSSFINRLNCATLDGLLLIQNCALAAFASADRGAPSGRTARVIAVCTPVEWSISNHGPLSTLGMSQLQQAFWSATPFKRNLLEDTVRVRLRKTSRHLLISRTFDFIVFEHEARRDFFTTFGGPNKK